MAHPPQARRAHLSPFADGPEGPADAGSLSTTLLGATAGVAAPQGALALHPLLRTQVEAATPRNAVALDVSLLLQAVSAHYDAIDRERRGIVRSMRLMADEAAALARDTAEQSSTHLRVILDHIKDVVLTVDEHGIVRTFNPTAERVFGYAEHEALGRSVAQLLPDLAYAGSVTAELHRLAASLDDTHRDLAAWQMRGRREDGSAFPVEVAVSSARVEARDVFIVCLRDVTGRKRVESVASGEREVLRLLTTNAPLPEALESIVRLVEAVEPEATCAISVLGRDGQSFASIVAPSLPERLRTVLGRSAIDIRNGPCAAAVHLGRRVTVSEVESDPHWHDRRDLAVDAGIRSSCAVPIRGAAGQTLGALALHRPSTGEPSARELELIEHAAQLAGLAVERRLAEEAIFAEKERAQVTLQSIGGGVISTDAEGSIEYLNPVAEALTGWSLGEARGRPAAEVMKLVEEGAGVPVADPVRVALGRAVQHPLAQHPVLVTRHGHGVPIEQSAAPTRDRNGHTIGAVVVFHDVTKERRLKRALSYQASHDVLTGLINRREFDARVEAAVQGAQRGEGTATLLYIDLDQFKVVNDTCGHSAGDRLIREITGILQSRVRAADTIARLGGDEFGVLLEGCDMQQSMRLAESMRQAIRDYRFHWNATTLSVGASIGMVEISAHTESCASVLSAADIACYAAKDEGRNRIHVYDSSGVSGRHREMHWVARLTSAADEDRFTLLYQPIVRVAAPGPATFHELTIALRDADGSLVPPGEFIPAAERYNVMSTIDRWVVQRAVAVLREIAGRGGERPLLAVNLSGNSLSDQTFIDFLLATAGQADVAHSLCFEITETAAVTNLANAVYLMRELKTRGCRFSLDDFGSGLSSFSYLKSLPVDFLKIDGQFVANVATDRVDRSMVEAISKVGSALGIATIAECVESPEVMAELERIPVDYVQGFLLARPRPLAELLAAGDSVPGVDFPV